MTKKVVRTEEEDEGMEEEEEEEDEGKKNYFPMTEAKRNAEDIYVGSDGEDGDSSSSDSSDEDYDDEEAGKRKRPKKQEKAAASLSEIVEPNMNLPLGGGTIEEIEVMDFMCHKHLKVALGPNINFITGPNGAGKSAIITALQVCFGSSARDTKRGMNIGDLVRNGAPIGHGATIRVTIANVGLGALKPKEYGSKIIIERNIPNDGKKSTTYKIYNGDTKKVAQTGHKYVDEIVEHFSLYVNNPCVLLDQESAKSFLKGKPEDKYSFFLKASELEKVQSSFRELKECRRETQEQLQKASDKLKEVEKECETTQRELERLRELETIQAKHRSAERSVCWATVNEEKRGAQKALTELTQQQDMLQKLDEARAGIEEEFQKAGEYRESLVERNKTMKDKMDTLKRRIDALQPKLKQVVEEERAAEKKVESLKKEIASMERKITNRQGELGLLKKKVSSSGSGKQALAAEIARKEKELSALTKEVEDAGETGLEAKYNQRTSLTEQMTSAESLIEQTQREIDMANGELRKVDEAKKRDEEMRKKNEIALKQYEMEREKMAKEAKANAASSPAAAAAAAASSAVENDENQAEYMGMLGAEVQSTHIELKRKEKMFSRAPFVLGAKIKLKKEYAHWGPVVEHIIGSHMGKVALTDDKDKKVLDGIFPGGLTRGVLIRKFTDKAHQTHHVPPDRTGPFLRLLDVLEIRDVNAMNVLLDIARLDGIVLIEDGKEAERRYLNSPTPSPGIIAVYDLQGNNYSIKKGVKLFEASEERYKKLYVFAENSPFITGFNNKSARSGGGVVVSSSASISQRGGLALPPPPMVRVGNSGENWDEKKEVMLNILRNHERNLKQYKTDLIKFQNDLAAIDLSLNGYQGVLDRITAKKNKVEDELNKLKEREEEDKDLRVDVQIELVQGEIDDFTNQVESKKTKDLVEAEEEWKKQSARQGPIRAEHDELKAELSELKRDEDSHDAKLSKSMDEQAKIKRKLNAAVAEIEDCKKQIDLLTASHEKKNSEYLVRLAQAQQTFPDSTDEEKETALPLKKAEAELEALARRLEAETLRLEKKKGKENRTAEELILAAQNNYQAAKDRYVKLKGDIERVKKRQKKLKKAIRKRKERFEQFKSHFERATRNGFVRLLNKKGHGGELKFDHEKKVIQIDFVKDGANADSSATQFTQSNDHSTSSMKQLDVGQLSGGERSYTTSALLLAMGRNIESPFRIMDEFDVFLDAEARAVVIRELIATARGSNISGVKQYVFITPQDLTEVVNENAPDIKVWKIASKGDYFDASRAAQ